MVKAVGWLELETGWCSSAATLGLIEETRMPDEKMVYPTTTLQDGGEVSGCWENGFLT